MSKYNKIYEFEYHLFGQVSEYSDIIRHAHIYWSGMFGDLHNSGFFVSQDVTVSMTSVSGHLLGLEFKAQFQKW